VLGRDNSRNPEVEGLFAWEECSGGRYAIGVSQWEVGESQWEIRVSQREVGVSQREIRVSQWEW